MKEKFHQLEEKQNQTESTIQMTIAQLKEVQRGLLDSLINLQHAHFKSVLLELIQQYPGVANHSRRKQEAATLIAEFAKRDVIVLAFQSAPVFADEELTQKNQTYQSQFKTESDAFIQTTTWVFDAEKEKEFTQLQQKKSDLNAILLQQRTVYISLVEQLGQLKNTLAMQQSELHTLSVNYRNSVIPILDGKNISLMRETFSQNNLANSHLPYVNELPLHYLCHSLAPTDVQIGDLVGELIFSGALVNSIDKEGNTPLHICCARGLLPAVDFLLSRKSKDIDFLLPNLESQSPLELAVKHQQVALVEYLLKRPKTDQIPIFSAHPKQTCSLFELALLSGNIDLIQLFFTHKVVQASNGIPTPEQIKRWMACINQGTLNQPQRQQTYLLLQTYLHEQEKGNLAKISESLVAHYYAALNIVRPQLAKGEATINAEQAALSDTTLTEVMKVLH